VFLKVKTMVVEKLILKVRIQRRIDARGEAWYEAEIKVDTCSGVLTGCVFTEEGIRDVKDGVYVNKEDETYKNYLVIKDKTLEALERKVSEIIRIVKNNREKVKKHIALVQDYFREFEVEI